MRQRFYLAALAVCGAGALAFAGHRQGQPYARLAPLPDSIGRDAQLQMEVRSVRTAVVPPLEAVLNRL